VGSCVAKKRFEVPEILLPSVKSSSEVYGEATIPRSRRRSNRRYSRRPAGPRSRDKLCFEPGEVKEYVRHRLFSADEHRRTHGAFTERTAYNGCVSVWQGASALCPGRKCGHQRSAGAMAAGQPGNHRKKSSDVEKLARSVKDNGDVYFVSGVQRALCAVLEGFGAWRDCGF